jgi:hypothetical protein
MDDYFYLSPIDKNINQLLGDITPTEFLYQAISELPNDFTIHFIKSLIVFLSPPTPKYGELFYPSPQNWRIKGNTVRISPPAPKFGGVDFGKSPRIGGFRGQTQELERLTEQNWGIKGTGA